jgi:hypothetical protein
MRYSSGFSPCEAAFQSAYTIVRLGGEKYYSGSGDPS